MIFRKNKKRIDPRYFLDETTYRDLNENVSDPVGAALHTQLVNNRAQSPETAMDVGELFDSEKGLVWQELATMGADEDLINRLKGQKEEYYNKGGGGGINIASDGRSYKWAAVGMSGEDKIYLDVARSRRRHSQGLEEGALGGENPHEQALERILRDAEATSPKAAMRANYIFNLQNGILWGVLERDGVSPKMIQYIQQNFMQKYTRGASGPIPGGKWVIAGTPNRETIYADYS